VSPRRSAAEARQTRDRLLVEATAMASTDGLEGVTVGRLAGAAGLSKSGVTRHFATKEELQLEAFGHALDLFRRTVWDPIADCPAGLERLRALCSSWTEHLAGDTFPGGCFLTAASTEFDGRTGPVRDAVAAALDRWLRVLGGEVKTAIANGELRASTDARAVAFQLNALAQAANQSRQLLGDDDAPARSLELMDDLLERHR